MDDVWWQKIPEDRRPKAEDRLLNSLAKTRAFLFVIGQAVDNPQGAAILGRWSSAGHRIGNRTCGHTALFGKITTEDFEAEILRADSLLSHRPGFRKWFRFPALKEGRTREVRDALREFLARHGYHNGAVSNRRSTAWPRTPALTPRDSASLLGPHLGPRAILRPAFPPGAGT